MDHSLPFLDVLLTRHNNTISTSVYRKPSFTGLGINFLSFIPDIFKSNSIKTLLYRCYALCSDWTSFDHEINFLTNFFVNNGFPLHIIHNTIKTFLNNKFSPTSTPPLDKSNTQYIKLPYYGYLSFSIRKRLQHLFRQAYPDTKFMFIFTNPHTIGSLFKTKDSLPLDLISNIVYQFICPHCKMGYVGETVRNLSLRFAEHKGVSARTGRAISSPPNSSIRSHSELHNHPFSLDDFSILLRSRSPLDLTTLESLYIKHLSPELNSHISSRPLYMFK